MRTLGVIGFFKQVSFVQRLMGGWLIICFSNDDGSKSTRIAVNVGEGDDSYHEVDLIVRGESFIVALETRSTHFEIAGFDEDEARAFKAVLESILHEDVARNRFEE